MIVSRRTRPVIARFRGCNSDTVAADNGISGSASGRRSRPIISVSDAEPGTELVVFFAIDHQLTLVTRNIKDFERFKLRLLNPWNAV